MRGKTCISILLAVSTATFFFWRVTSSSGSVVTHRRVPEFHDWSTRHVVYPNGGFLRELDLAAMDPRASFAWRNRLPDPETRRPLRLPIRHPLLPRRRTLQRDWSISLGTAGTPVNQYPAKFTFDVTQAPSCANDYVVYPIAAKGSSSQPNLAAFNNLYSGTGGGGTGYCNRTASASDLGTSATVFWSYNVQAISGGASVPTSPVISYDPLNAANSGAKIAFVESIAGSAAHFHVLAWKSGDGKNASNLQSVLTPKTISTFTTSAAASGTATDLALGASASGSDTNSSPFVDYVRDVAYVGNDAGVLYRVKDVFCTSINPDCSGTTKPAPSLDSTWGTGGAVTVCSGALTGPVLDFVTLNVYVGCSDGKLYSVSQSGTIKSITVGDGVASKTYGAIVDPPIVDGVNAFVYAVSGSASNGANGVLVQAKIDFSSSVAVPVGAGNQCNMHAPALTNAYYTNPTSSGSLIYVAGVTGTVGPCTATGATAGAIVIYGAGFGAGGILKSGAPTNSSSVGNPGNEFAPLTEFFNSTANEDFLFFAVLCTGADMDSYNVTNGWSSTFLVTPLSEGLGTSGMVVDNNANTTTYPQAASIYFNALNEDAACSSPQTGTNTGGCAIKLTQAALQ